MYVFCTTLGGDWQVRSDEERKLATEAECRFPLAPRKKHCSPPDGKLFPMTFMSVPPLRAIPLLG
jgi:hypothetical protein